MLKAPSPRRVGMRVVPLDAAHPVAPHAYGLHPQP